MLSGVKFISREQIDSVKYEEVDGNEKGRSRKSSNKKVKSRKKGSKYNSSDDEESERITKGSSKKKWHPSDNSTSSSDDDAERGSSFEDGEKRHKSYKDKGKRWAKSDERMKKKSKRSKREYSSDESSLSSSEADDQSTRRKGKSKGKEKSQKDDDLDFSDGAGGLGNNIDIVRKEMGLDWMLRPEDRPKKNYGTTDEVQPPLEPSEESLKSNPRELNPYLRDSGSGYPEDAQTKSSGNQLLSSSVGDGGASWRLKALKRAKEQAAREGRDLKEVVQDRWGDLGHLAVSVSSRSAAAPRAHLHAIKSRMMGSNDDNESDSRNQLVLDSEKVRKQEYLRDVSVRHPDMRAPVSRASLSWGKNRSPQIHSRDAALISSAISGINKFANDGSFMSEVMNKQNVVECGTGNVSKSNREGSDNDATNTKCEGTWMAECSSVIMKSSEQKPPMSANQLAAKAMQLRLKGKHEEAYRLLKEDQNTKVDQAAGERITKLRNDVTASRYTAEEKKLQQKGKEDDSDIHLAQTIMKNKQYSMSTQADDEYDYDGTPSRKSRRKGAEEQRSDGRKNVGRRIVTQQERCVFCFENPNGPRHLVVAIANFSYLMLPQFTPVAPGHCCIVTLQHEQATRMVDDNVWEEIRNFKKCLIMMFAKQEKECIFLETVLWLAQQRRHCLIECIPVPQDVAKDAPLYFKKAIDEAESEWSQHDAKKLIDTSQKGLRGSVPKNFPYFHVEFGLKRGFVHVIDDETQFKSSFGLNVVRGMLQSQDEDMYRRRRYETVEVQKEAVASFAKEWEPLDWTKQL